MNIHIEWAYNQITENQPEYDLYHNYYNGKQELYYGGTKKYKHLNELLQGTRANVCKAVIDILCSRLEFECFTSSDSNVELINDYCQRERLVSLLKSVVRDCAIYGDAYVALWIDENKAVKMFQKSAFNTAVHYNAENQIDQAVSYKYYRDLEDKPRTSIWVYTPDYIYMSDYSGNFIKGVLEVDEKSAYSNPFGIVPIFHFYNGYKPTDFLRSDLTEVIPIQRHLNSIMQQRMIASELAAFTQKWATGMVAETDENGKAINPFDGELGKLWISTNSETRFGEFSATDLSNYTNVIDSLHQEISVVSRIPLYMLTLNNGNFPSGEALKTAEAPLIAKISDKQVFYGDILEDMMKTICRYSGITINDDLSCVWKDTQPHNDLEATQVAANKIGLGVPQEVVLREMGYQDYTPNTQDDYYKNLNQIPPVG